MARFYNPYYGGLLNGTDDDDAFTARRPGM